jgi:hypothetical protein
MIQQKFLNLVKKIEKDILEYSKKQDHSPAAILVRTEQVNIMKEFYNLFLSTQENFIEVGQDNILLSGSFKPNENIIGKEMEISHSINLFNGSLSYNNEIVNFDKLIIFSYRIKTFNRNERI